MADVHMYIRARYWPERTRIRVSLREGSKDGKPISGRVVIVARKGDDTNSDQPLGYPSGDLVVTVANGEWESPAPGWNYDRWAKEGHTRLVARLEGGDMEWIWDSKAPRETRKPSVPTFITKIQQIRTVDAADDAKVHFAHYWTTLDQYRERIAGSVIVVFDGSKKVVESDPDRLGVCLDTVTVEGFTAKGTQIEKSYVVLPPTGEPQSLTLKGAEPKPARTMAALSEINFAKRPHPTNPEIMVYDLSWSVTGNDNKPFAKPLVNRLLHDLRQVQGDLEGCCTEYDVEVTGYEAQVTYTVMIPGSTDPNARKEVVLAGPKTPEPKTPEPPITMMVNIEGDVITTNKFRAVLPLITATQDSNEGKSSQFEFCVLEGAPVLLFDETTGAQLTPSPTKYFAQATSPDGRFRLGVNFKGQFEITVELFHPTSQQRRKLKLVYKQ